MKKLDMQKKVNTIGGFGYKWTCLNTGWVSSWHLTYSGASKYAMAHQAKYNGHVASVFAV